MYAEIISVGSELLTPDRVDTNSLWLGAQLNRYGIELRRKVIWGDEVEGLGREIREALGRSPLVITTGGLGPTEDDVTRESVAWALNTELVLQDALVTELEQKFARFGRPMSPNNRRQCFVPTGGEALANPVGTAPGLKVAHGDSLLFVLPGPPREMKPMFTAEVEPVLTRLAGPRRVKRRILRVIGLGESVLDEKIAPIYKPIDNPRVGILFSALDVEVHLTATASTEEQADALNQDLAVQIYSALGQHIYGEEDVSLAQAALAALDRVGGTLAVADCGTAGLVAHRLCEVRSARFKGGLVSAGRHQTAAWLMTDHAEGIPSAEWLAAAVRTRVGTRYGLAVVELEPDGEQAGKIGKYAIALDSDDGTSIVREFTFPGDGEIRRSRAAQGALDLVRRSMQP